MHTFVHLKYQFLARNMAHHSSAVPLSEAIDISKEMKRNVSSERKPTKYPVAVNFGMHQHKREYAPFKMSA